MLRELNVFVFHAFFRHVRCVETECQDTPFIFVLCALGYSEVILVRCLVLDDGEQPSYPFSLLPVQRNDGVI